jgi:4-hydroxy-3-polyprenylbenzoate decarboxylase
MTGVTGMGGITMPPVTAFYASQQTLDDMVEHSVGRALNLFDIDTGIARRGATHRPRAAPT